MVAVWMLVVVVVIGLLMVGFVVTWQHWDSVGSPCRAVAARARALAARARAQADRAARARAARAAVEAQKQLERDILAKQESIAKLKVAINKAKEEHSNALAEQYFEMAEEAKTTLKGLQKQVVVAQEELRVLIEQGATEAGDEAQNEQEATEADVEAQKQPGAATLQLERDMCRYNLQIYL